MYYNFPKIAEIMLVSISQTNISSTGGIVYLYNFILLFFSNLLFIELFLLHFWYPV